MAITKTCMFRMLGMLVFMSCAINCDNRFDKVQKYMNTYYTQGYHSQWLFRSYSHDVFLKDFESNKLFKDFKQALVTGSADEAIEARQVYDAILTDLKKCLKNEIDYRDELAAQYKKIEPVLDVNTAVLWASWLYFKCARGIGFWEMVFRPTPIGSHVGDFSTAERAVSYYVGGARLAHFLMLAGQYLDMKVLDMSIDTLERRIKAWSALL